MHRIHAHRRSGLLRHRDDHPAKSGGNLSEALGNLAGVLRDRKRLQGKIKAMSSEAKASAMIIGSLPPVVMGIVYITTPGYIMTALHRAHGQSDAGGLRVLDGHRHHGDAQDDQLQALRRHHARRRHPHHSLRQDLPGHRWRRRSSPSPPSSRWACRCSSATGWATALKSVARGARNCAPAIMRRSTPSAARCGSSRPTS